MNRPSFHRDSFKRVLFLGIVALFCSRFSAICHGAEEANSQAVESQETPRPQTFSQQLQEYFYNAKDAGTTTATSAGNWLAEQYEYASKNTSETTGSAMTWLTQQYNHAIEAGDTRAKSAKSWLADDLGKVGTWQYKIVRAADMAFEGKSHQEKLNELGRERWECFSVVSYKGGLTYYLKRPHRSYLQQLPAKELLRLAPLLNFASEEE